MVIKDQKLFPTIFIGIYLEILSFGENFNKEASLAAQKSNAASQLESAGDKKTTLLSSRNCKFDGHILFLDVPSRSYACKFGDGYIAIHWPVVWFSYTQGFMEQG